MRIRILLNMYLIFFTINKLLTCIRKVHVNITQKVNINDYVLSTIIFSQYIITNWELTMLIIHITLLGNTLFHLFCAIVLNICILSWCNKVELLL